MNKKLTFFESLFLNRRGKEMALSSGDSDFNDLENTGSDDSYDNINEDTETSIKNLLEKTTSLSNIDANAFIKDTDSSEENDLILFDTIDIDLEKDFEDDYSLTDELEEEILEDVLENAILEGVLDEVLEEITEDNLFDDSFDDDLNDVNIGDTIVFNVNELKNLVDTEIDSIDESLSDIENLDFVEDLESLEDLELLETVELEFVSLDFGDDLDLDVDSTSDSNSDFDDLDFDEDNDDVSIDTNSTIFDSGIMHFDLDDQLTNEDLDSNNSNYTTDNTNFDDSTLDESSLDSFSLLDDNLLGSQGADFTQTETSILVDDTESNFPTLSELTDEPQNVLSDKENSDDDEINIPMI